jgi:hypothetical protein
MNRRLGVVLAAGLALLLGVGLWWWFDNYDWVEEEVTLPPRGMARYNPLYGLQRGLEALGHTLQARPTLAPAAMRLAPGELLVLGSDLRTVGDEQAAALLGFVEAGGTLLFALPEGASTRTPPLLAQLDARLVEGSGCSTLGDGTRLCPAQRLRPNAPEAIDWDTREGDAEAGYLRGIARHGAGRWAFAGDFAALRGRALDEAHNVVVAWQLLGPLLPAPGRRIHLVYAVDMPPLYVLLLRDGWPLWLPLLLALLAWLWARAARLGPLRPLPPPDRRALLEHVQAAAGFVLRRGRADTLLAALQRRLQRRLAQRHPAIAALALPEQVVALAELAGVDQAALRQALVPAPPVHAEAFRSAVSTLVQIESRL